MYWATCQGVNFTERQCVMSEHNTGFHVNFLLNGTLGFMYWATCQGVNFTERQCVMSGHNTGFHMLLCFNVRASQNDRRQYYREHFTS